VTAVHGLVLSQEDQTQTYLSYARHPERQV